MAKVQHPVLGSIDLARPGAWEATVAFGGRAVEFDLTIDEPGLTAEDLDGLPRGAEDLGGVDQAARAAILEDARSGDEDASAKMYLSHHENLLSPEELRRAFGTDKPGSADAEAMLSRLALVRVGLYPEIEDARVLLDYSIGTDLTDYLLSVSFDSTGQVTGVSMES